MGRAEVEALIKAAFKDVKLGGGVSLRQAEVMDNYGRGATIEEYRALPKGEITADWAAIAMAELEQYPLLAHMDAEGFRYYIPAFMLSLLAEYDKCSMRVITTLGGLTPEPKDRWDYCMMHYSLLDRQQRCAVAGFLYCLPSVAELGEEDQELVLSALSAYWEEYL